MFEEQENKIFQGGQDVLVRDNNRCGNNARSIYGTER